MKKLNELPFELVHFQAEELEERLESCWKGMKKETITTTSEDGCTTTETEVLVKCKDQE